MPHAPAEEQGQGDIRKTAEGVGAFRMKAAGVSAAGRDAGRPCAMRVWGTRGQPGGPSSGMRGVLGFLR